MKYPEYTIPDGTFPCEAYGKTYTVEYWDEGNGILRYKYEPSDNSKKEPEKSLAVAPAHAPMFDVYGQTRSAKDAAAIAASASICAMGFAVFAWGHTAYSVFCDDPISRANQRGYSLK